MTVSHSVGSTADSPREIEHPPAPTLLMPVSVLPGIVRLALRATCLEPDDALDWITKAPLSEVAAVSNQLTRTLQPCPGAKSNGAFEQPLAAAAVTPKRPEPMVTEVTLSTALPELVSVTT